MAQKKNTENAGNGSGQQERKPLTAQDRLRIRQEKAKDPRAFVLICDAPLSHNMSRVLDKFNFAYTQFKLRLGEPGGLGHEEGEHLMAEGRDILLRFNEFTARFHKIVGWRYQPPAAIKELQKLGE